MDRLVETALKTTWKMQSPKQFLSLVILVLHSCLVTLGHANELHVSTLTAFILICDLMYKWDLIFIAVMATRRIRDFHQPNENHHPIPLFLWVFKDKNYICNARCPPVLIWQLCGNIPHITHIQTNLLTFQIFCEVWYTVFWMKDHFISTKCLKTFFVTNLST